MYCDVYISRPTRCTNSYNVPLLIIKRSICFGLLSHQERLLELYIAIGICRYHTSGRCVGIIAQLPDVSAFYDIQLQNVAPDDGLKSPKHVEHLMINKDT